MRISSKLTFYLLILFPIYFCFLNSSAQILPSVIFSPFLSETLVHYKQLLSAAL
uniref:Uncharacterized protein n=1 Tax=Rhizophora mucronata TaxID=61149 RepID=A0A2P2PKI5_RHIMU